MKLYTEEQIKFAMLSAYLTGVTRPPSYEEAEEVLFNSLTPIELPSDEEIENILDPRSDEYAAGFYRAMEMIEEQILNQNK